MASTFAVCRTAEIPAEVTDRFLSGAYARSDELSPGLGSCLVVLGTDDPNSTTPTPAGSADQLAPSPFLDMSTPAEVATRLGAPRNRYFVIMDKRSTEDDTVLLVSTQAEGEPQTVRSTFVSSQCTLVGLDMATQGFEEVQAIAESDPDGVYGPERSSRQPRRGGPAPRMRLGGGGD